MTRTAEVLSVRHIRQANAQAVLDHMWHSGAVTGSDLMSATGLTRATVHDVCDELRERGWVVELANQRAAGQYSKGRPARRYAFDPRAGVVVGVDAALRAIGVCVADLRGAVLARYSIPLDPGAPVSGPSRPTVVDEAIDQALDRAGLTHDKVMCTTIGVPAPVVESGATGLRSRSFWDEMNPDYRAALSDRLGVLVVENDANLAALAEGWIGATVGATDYVCILSGEGLGAGVVHGGRLVRGGRGGIGELAFLDYVRGVGSTKGMAPLALDWAGDNPGDDQRQIDSSASVFAAATRGEEWATSVVGRLGPRLARICGIVSAVYDVPVVVVSGEPPDDLDALVTCAEAAQLSVLPMDLPEMRPSTLGRYVVALGAVKRSVDLVRSSALDLRPMTVAR